MAKRHAHSCLCATCRVPFEEARGDSRMHHIFVYGTLREGGFNHQYLKIPDHEARPLYMEAYMPGRLYAWGGIPFAMHCKSTVLEVYGEVYEVDALTKLVIDKLEGVGTGALTWYSCERVEVRVTDSSWVDKASYNVNVWAYVFPEMPPLRNVVPIRNKHGIGDYMEYVTTPDSILREA